LRGAVRTIAVMSLRITAVAKTAIHAFDDFKADRIVAEGNQGGNMVRYTLTTVRKDLPITIVHASQSKQARAEPVSALYEQKKVSHAKAFAELEDQLCTWEPLSGDESPDRLDALVWAMTDLFLRGHEPVKFPGAYVVQRVLFDSRCPSHLPPGLVSRDSAPDGGAGYVHIVVHFFMLLAPRCRVYARTVRDRERANIFAC
jgi:hypothetical protein